MSSSDSPPRFRVESFDNAADGVLDPGVAVHRHLRVLRLTAGAIVCLFDGRGTEMRAELVRIDESDARLRLLEALDRKVESPLRVSLVQAVPVRSARMETIVRQSTELGVERIVPVMARHSQQARVKPAALRRKGERWQRVADSAAEQCGRVFVPRVEEPLPFADLAWEGLLRPFLIATPEADPGAPAGLAAMIAESGGVTVMVGPEGGWADEELEAASRRDAVAWGLGPRVLRADSAGVVAITLLQYLHGDLR